MKAILVEELQEAMKNALVDAWKEVEEIKRQAAADKACAEADAYFESMRQQRGVLHETTYYS